MNALRLEFTRNDNRSSLSALQVLRHRVDPGGRASSDVRRRDATSLCKLIGDARDLTRLDGEAMIGKGAGDSQRRLDRIVAVALIAAFHRAPRRKLPRIQQRSRPMIDEVRVQTDDDVRLRQLVRDDGITPGYFMSRRSDCRAG